MKYTIKPFEELDLIDDFLANAVADDAEVGEDFCRTLVQALLQQEVGKINVSVQRVIQGNTPEQRGIRLDIEIVEEDENIHGVYKKNIFNIEPQKRKDINLIKHNRFYQAKIDSRNLKSGDKDFIALPNLFVITITNYDPFGYDYMLYTIHNICEEVPQLKYEDGLRFLYFNTKGIKGGSEAIKNLLNYIQNSKEENVTDEATKKLHNCVSKVKVLPEVREEYMMWEEKLFYERLDGKAEGRTEEQLRIIKEKLNKGKTLEEIADNLEISLDEVKEILQRIQDEVFE